MIELQHDQLKFTFPKVHESADFTVRFNRTLRIPDDGRSYPLPPGLGAFPLRHVDDHNENVPEAWIKHGGVMLPMYQSEALWLGFASGYDSDRQTSYPVAIKVATGKINAVTGKSWSNELKNSPQDYMVAPKQPWLDGYCVEKGFISQFVAMPLGSGYSVEEQVTGEAEHGGLQIIVYPMKREVYEKRFPIVPKRQESRRARTMQAQTLSMAPPAACAPGGAADMGLAPGGRMKQEIYDDPFDFNDWDTENGSRCFVHIANSLVWRQITGSEAPTVPPTSKEYARAGLPWFDYYDDSGKAVKGSSILSKLKSVVTMGKEKGDNPLPENESVDPEKIITIKAKLKKGQVREGEF